ncbi:MAG: hypothetical protein QXO70_01035, partial [Candidatus Pacearchaeota archaeon]
MNQTNQELSQTEQQKMNQTEQQMNQEFSQTEQQMNQEFSQTEQRPQTAIGGTAIGGTGTCQYCGASFERRTSKSGRKRIYCCGAHKSADYYRRMRIDPKFKERQHEYARRARAKKKASEGTKETAAPTDAPAPIDTPTVAPIDTPTVAPIDTPTVAPIDTPTVAPEDERVDT